MRLHLAELPRPRAVGVVDLLPHLRAVIPPPGFGAGLAANGECRLPLLRAVPPSGRLLAIETILAIGRRDAGAPFDVRLGVLLDIAHRVPGRDLRAAVA